MYSKCLFYQKNEHEDWRISNFSSVTSSWHHFKIKTTSMIYFVFFKDSVTFLTNRVNSPNSGCLPNTRYRRLYTMMRHFAAFGHNTNWWAALQPLALLYNSGPLYGPFPIFSKHPGFGEFTLNIYCKKISIFFKFKYLTIAEKNT